ncbi:hypothetical protein M8C21_004411, partial [Ambrosia artemisiifolia]
SNGELISRQINRGAFDLLCNRNNSQPAMLFFVYVLNRIYSVMPPRKRKSTSNNDCDQASSNDGATRGCQTAGQAMKIEETSKSSKKIALESSRPFRKKKATVSTTNFFYDQDKPKKVSSDADNSVVAATRDRKIPSYYEHGK